MKIASPFNFDDPAVASCSAGAGEVDPEAEGAAAAETLDGATVASGSALGGAGDDDPGGTEVEAVEVPPRLAR